MRWLVLVALLPSLLLAQATGPAEKAGVAVYVGDEILMDYHPTSKLVTAQTSVRKPRFPVVDIHCHWSITQDPAELLRAMDELGMTKANNLSGGYGKSLDAMLEKFHNAAPDRLLVFCNVDWKQIDSETFATDVAAYLRHAHEAGASGLKVFKDLGLTVRDKSGGLVPIDDPRLDVVWKVCGELKMPVLIHAGDPRAFFDPVDSHNERWMQLKRHPDWSFYGAKYPTWEEVMAQHNRMIARHPDTVFITAHLANCGDNLPMLAQWLDAMPNVYADISGRVPELGRQPYAARRFLEKYQDRIMFGTDRYPGRSDQKRNAIYYRFLETHDEYFDYYDHAFPTEGEWKIYGVYLPDDILRKVYSQNADRALQGLPPLRPQ